MAEPGARRRRSSSILQVHYEPQETLEQISDQAVVPNLNANWVNAKGAWTIHFVLILCLKIFYDVMPGVSQETSWTLTNISYMFGSYIMFHYVRGVPFEFNGGAFDNLNMWEQIDDGAQYTPAKKFLLSVPIVLFLLSTHYTHYDLAYFIINFLAVLAVVIPKLPFVCGPPAVLFLCARADNIRRATGCDSAFLIPNIELHDDKALGARLWICRDLKVWSRKKAYIASMVRHGVHKVERCRLRRCERGMMRSLEATGTRQFDCVKRSAKVSQSPCFRLRVGIAGRASPGPRKSSDVDNLLADGTLALQSHFTEFKKRVAGDQRWKTSDRGPATICTGAFSSISKHGFKDLFSHPSSEHG
ncbi:ORMDL family protein [Colletotrichum graminicola]|nr:ORMDL family protein [Colletotrichum graminicola]